MHDFTQEVDVAEVAEPNERAAFIRRTYAHLAAAILVFIGMEAYMVNSPIAAMLLNVMSMRFGWLVILGGFVLFGNMASGLAYSSKSQNVQYVGLTLYIIVESVIFAPILHIAANLMQSPEIILTAGLITLCLFGGLTLVVFTTKKDFSFLSAILKISSMVALGLIICSVLFGFSLGIIFSFAMVLLASGAILFDTSRIMKHYRTDQHVAASLQLFASVALLFWYVLRILMSLSRR